MKKPISAILKISVNLFLILLLFLSTKSISAQSQILTNKVWSISKGNPISGIDWSASVIDQDKNIITVGNTVDNSFNIDLLIVKQSSTGEVIWEKEYSAGTNTSNYGIAVTLDGSGNIYIAGATYNPLNQNHDYLILKYSSAGSIIWSHIENGIDNGEDIPSGIVLDNNDNVYVTGGSYSNSTNYDYLTLRLNGNGLLNWKDRYDYNNFANVAIAIDVDANGDIAVNGSSSLSSTSWSYNGIKYNSTNGNLIGGTGINQTAINNTGLETPTAFVINGSNNIIVTGYGGSQNDCHTLLLDQDFNLIWETSYDGYGLDDKAFDVEVDNNNNVYICGYTEKANGGKDFLLIKYDSNGNEVWTKRRTARDPEKSAKARFLEIDPVLNHILVTGEEIGSNEKSYLKTIRYDDSGKMIWEDIHNVSDGDQEKSTGLFKTGEEGFIITGILQENDGSQKYESVKYKTYDKEVDYDYENEVAINLKGEVIVRFYPTVIDTAFADNPDLLFGTVGEIITDNNLISEMDAKLGGDGKINDWKMVKQYPFMSTSDRTFVSKYGTTVPINSVWTTYRLSLKEDLSAQSASDSLNGIDFKQIMYALVDPVGRLMSPPPPPNDEYYNLQTGLHDIVGINVEPAWDGSNGEDAVNGDPSIRVGFVDSGLAFGHPDFGTQYGGLGGSVVAAGYNFVPNTTEPVPFDDNFTDNDLEWPHGTRMAGIVGALRNNNLGISGIAGGDVDGGEGSGVSLTAFKAFNGGEFQASKTGPAILFAATGGDGTGNLVDVLNNSYGWEPTPSSIEGEFYIKEYLTPAFKSGMIVLAARGNVQDQSTDDLIHPATLREKMIISVGASGTDGALKETIGNSSGVPPDATGEHWMSIFGEGMDIIAPGTSNLILTTNNLESPQTFEVGCDTPLNDFDGNLAYSCFNGSSSATAFASGVSALVLEQHTNKHNTILAHEDVEKLLEYGATSVGSGGYDEKNAWGRLNAGESIGLISGTQKVVHFNVRPNASIVCGGCNVELTDFYESPFTIYDGTGIIPGETPLLTQVIKHTYDINIDFCGDYNAEIIDPGISVGKDPVWLLNSRSNLWGKAFQDLPGTTEDITAPEDFVYWESEPEITVNNCVLTGTIAGYSYNLFTNDFDEPIPNDGNDYQMWFSVLVNDPQGNFDDVVTSVTQSEKPKNQIFLFPNPAKDKLKIKISNENLVAINQLELFDMNGRLLKSKAVNSTSQKEHNLEFDTSSLPSGIYTIRVESSGGIYQDKFIKLH